MSMRDPALDLPLMLVEVRILAGDVAILDGITLEARRRPADRADRSERLRQDHAAARGHGAYPRLERPASPGAAAKHSPPTRRAIVFQRPAMLRRSAAGNIRYALAAAGRAARQARRPHRRVAGRRRPATGSNRRPARRLSGGEQQRLALARALARDPAMLFLDEPTASLDPAATKAIEDIVRAVTARGVKVVMSTHDLGQAKRIGRRHRAAASRPPDRNRAGRGILRRAAHAKKRENSSPANCWCKGTT